MHGYAGSVAGKTYTRGVQKVEVLHGIDLAIEAGDFVALMGPSGSGKTTLLNLIGGLDAPTGGSIFVDRKKNITSLLFLWRRQVRENAQGSASASTKIRTSTTASGSVGLASCRLNEVGMAAGVTLQAVRCPRRSWPRPRPRCRKW